MTATAASTAETPSPRPSAPSPPDDADLAFDDGDDASPRDAAVLAALATDLWKAYPSSRRRARDALYGDRKLRPPPNFQDDDAPFALAPALAGVPRPALADVPDSPGANLKSDLLYTALSIALVAAAAVKLAG